eukprot:8825831-Lingulodinium_polyedra.AAC.1
MATRGIFSSPASRQLHAASPRFHVQKNAAPWGIFPTARGNCAASVSMRLGPRGNYIAMSRQPPAAHARPIATF